MARPGRSLLGIGLLSRKHAANSQPKNSTQGLGTLVADIIVPLIEIRSVHFGSTTGQKSVLGDLKLQTPLKLEADYRGAEIAVVLEKTDHPGRQVYAPISAATNLWHPEGTRVYYNPKFATTANLPLGVTLHIPEKATESPHIFHVSVHKAGGAFPTIDIFPQVKLSKEATITMSRIERPQPPDRQAKLETLDLVPHETGEAPRSNKNCKKKSFKVFDTGLIDGDSSSAALAKRRSTTAHRAGPRSKGPWSRQDANKDSSRATGRAEREGRSSP